MLHPSRTLANGEAAGRRNAGARDNQPVRWHYRDPHLTWLLPLAYAGHIIEEWAGGFPEWIAEFIGAPLPPSAFIIINGIAMTALIVAISASNARAAHGWAGIAAATVLFVNALAHVLGTIVTRTYSPGLLTGLVLYVPLASLVLLRASSQAPAATLALGVASGIAVHAVVFVAAYFAAS